uniref:Uncharacterized protein n=1 Tax=Trichobilharzia regenti TaxID=157069 RepID=A0AA85IVN9_TRIRE|nr:unnamed protein product [Trichobilharzia regenti]
MRNTDHCNNYSVEFTRMHLTEQLLLLTFVLVTICTLEVTGSVVYERIEKFYEDEKAWFEFAKNAMKTLLGKMCLLKKALHIIRS